MQAVFTGFDLITRVKSELQILCKKPIKLFPIRQCTVLKVFKHVYRLFAFYKWAILQYCAGNKT